MNKAVGDYRDEMDSIGQFLDEYFVRDASKMVLAAGLRDKYKEWCRDTNTFALNRPNLNAALEKAGLKPVDTRLGKAWQGVKFGPAVENENMARALNYNVPRSALEVVRDEPLPTGPMDIVQDMAADQLTARIA